MKVRISGKNETGKGLEVLRPFVNRMAGDSCKSHFTPRAHNSQDSDLHIRHFLLFLWKMKCRYLYLDSGGIPQGPVWLSQMRELYACGRIHAKTEICEERERIWSQLSSFPEITLVREEMEQAVNVNSNDRVAYERRMWRWLGLLVTLYVVYAAIQFL